MKRISLIIVLLSVVCGATIRAQDPIQSYTKPPKVESASADSVKQKEKIYKQPVRPTQSKTVFDNREVIVTKDAFDTQKLAVKTVPPEKLTGKKQKPSPPLSPTQRSKTVKDRTNFSPVQHAPQ